MTVDKKTKRIEVIDGKKYYVRDCLLCHKEFKTRNKVIYYCSDDHMTKCPLCEKTFNRTSIGNHFCHTPHEGNCAICGKPIMIKNYDENMRYTCGAKECSKKAQILTNREKYGVDWPNQSKSVRDKTKKTSMQRYGVDNPAKSDKVKEITKKNNLEKYGVTSTAKLDSSKKKAKETFIKNYGTIDPLHKNKEVLEKSNSTKMSKYGTTNTSATMKIKNKIKETNNKKYGVAWSTQSPEIKDKMKASLMKNYGVDNPSKSAIIQEKIKHTNLTKYGAPNIMQSEFGKNKLKDIVREKYNVDNIDYKDIKHYEDYIDLDNFVKDNHYTITQLSEYFNVSRQHLHYLIGKRGLDKYFEDFYTLSAKETEFEYFLKNDNQLKNIKYIKHDRKILEGKELDFYFPNNKLAVEISPTSTHNYISNWHDNIGKPKNYHKDKFIKCANKGIELITIFDWHDWAKMLELIKAKLQAADNRIYARNTQYYLSEKITKELFDDLSNWHILGLTANFNRHNEVGILKHDNDIVGLALWTKTQNTNEIELKRMVFKPGYSVIGGASKLLKNFMKEHNYKHIITFSDCDLGMGSVYSKIGFTLSVESKPNLIYFNDKYKWTIKYNALRMQGADRLLAKFPGYIPVGMGDNLPSNREIVESYGFLPVYDCGYRKWELNAK